MSDMLNFLIAPDFPPENFVGWHIFNTVLQRKIDIEVHLITPADHDEQMEFISQGQVGLIYANPFDATELVRHLGFLPVAKPIEQFDEMVIATHFGTPYQHSDDLRKGCRILITNNRDVKLIGLRLLESAGLEESDIEWKPVASFQAAAYGLIKGEADAAFFLASAYHEFNTSTKRKLRPLMESRLNELSHVILLRPDFLHLLTAIKRAFIGMRHDAETKFILEDLGIVHGFEDLTVEETEFMIDLMETLKD
jgi:hypothetical protein